jgi:hypothetical protein
MAVLPREMAIHREMEHRNLERVVRRLEMEFRLRAMATVVCPLVEDRDLPAAHDPR